MRARELVAIAALAATVSAGCATGNPDPRGTTLEDMQRTGFGAWVTLTTTAGGSIQGELISVEPTSISVFVHELPGARLAVVPKAEIAEGALYTYESEGFAGWGVVGALSTLSHGFLLVLSGPVWALWTGITGAAESGHVIIRLRRGAWKEVAMWARFPQGMPPGFGAPGYR